jgi:hypothetical protein
LKSLIISTFVLAILVGCVDKQGNAPSAESAQIDKTADIFYNGLMNNALKTKLTDSDYKSDDKVGEVPKYRTGGIFRYKAMVSCLSWDIPGRKVVSKSFVFVSSDDWGYAEYTGLKSCEEDKQQGNRNCTCQIVDHNEKNVLKIPEDFRVAFESKKAK